MEPNLYEGDYIVVSKYAYGWSKHSIPFSPPLFEGRIFERSPMRGDIVVFKLPRDTKIDAWLGYERRLSDGRRWSTQLNLRNVRNDDALIPIATQPDGSIARVAVPQPFTWEVTTTLHF